MKRRRQGWPPLTSAKKATANVAALDRARREQDARRREPRDQAQRSRPPPKKNSGGETKKDFQTTQ